VIAYEEDTDVATRGRGWLGSLAGRRVTVVGLAKSGIAAARLLQAAGAQVTGTDLRPLDALSGEAAALEAVGVRLVTGPAAAGGEAAFEGAVLAVVSPGVPLDAPQLARARTLGVPVIGELELGWRAMESDTIAITGTNGKTTTTALTGALLAEQPRPVLVGGNIGTPLTAHALSFPADGLVVAEVSSFQLETIETFRPRVAAVLNITPDHLDRHGDFAAYVDAKARIFLNQTAADCAVLNADDPATAALAPRTRAHVLWFSRRTPLAHGVFVRDGRLVAKLNGHVEDIMPLAEIGLRGQHNVENVLAATACALWMGLGAAAIRRAVGRFRAVAHRIEFVRDVRGVQFYNDSKGTNVASTIKALESFGERVLLIAGGKGKGQDFGPLAEAARGRVAHAVTLGEDGPAIATALRGAGIPVSAAPTLAAAIDTALAQAQAGDVVLLSPACASFDMFRNYEHRGDVFKELVHRLAAVAGAGA
jgi:UDP-N-acetylmuramoylalanine--D-glutamate ligase